jgi:hypothetical protein
MTLRQRRLTQRSIVRSVMSHPRLATVSLTRSRIFHSQRDVCNHLSVSEHSLLNIVHSSVVFLLLVLIINKFDMCGTEWDHLSRAMLAKAGVNALGNSVHWFLSWHVRGWTPIMSLAIINRLLACASKQHRVSLFDVL